MTLREQIYQFGNLGIHEAIIVQNSIEMRKSRLTTDPEPKRSEKEIKTIMDELDQFLDDLDRHISACVRRQELEKEVKTREVQLTRG